MNNYTIHCTVEQIKKAIELGAPIERYSYNYNNIDRRPHYIDYGVDWNFYRDKNRRTVTIIPTTEQMIGWLKEQGVLCDIFPNEDYGKEKFGVRIMIKKRSLNRFDSDYKDYNSRKEATLAVINLALDYLTKNNK